jgi:pyruvate/2-oxoglutarate dehydrogenase complex dihydrolipoamide acyltransferase (E2) component
MPRPIVMPSLGMYTTEGTVTAWLREPGSQVAAGEPVVEVTTEKAVYQIEAPGDGVLHAVAEIGAVVPDQGLIGHVLAPGEDPPPAERPRGRPVAPGRRRHRPRSRRRRVRRGASCARARRRAGWRRTGASTSRRSSERVRAVASSRRT